SSMTDPGPHLVIQNDGQHAPTITIEAALAWCQQVPGPAHPGRASSVGSARMTAVRGFARYLSGIDADTQVPPLGLMPYRTGWTPPFIYSTAQIEALLDAARTQIQHPLQSATYQTLIGLLAVSGLRIGEALKLDRGDIDWDRGVLLIRESKFGKTRLVPLHTSSTAALAGYAQVRDRLQPRSKDPSFFVSRTRKRLLYPVVHPMFRRLVTQVGIGADAPCPPRLHDLRHTFAVRTLLGWYRTGQDVQTLLPALSTYLGHREPASTYWYLSAAPELLALAAARRDNAWQVDRS
ncbi:MAG: tyrosine-type recombinase/integrase, partial [Humibacillus sp.]|nr:tyrosine-type recombinase/integrase [Humibacillus sp.]MDN5779644.1 tyrosine-type recombinase/integrase [Humibacillus sp.]